MKVIRSIRRVAPSLNDADLVLAARSGEPWAREALIERHCEAAHRLAFVLLGPHGGSRNAVEMAFRRSFPGYADFSYALWRVVRKPACARCGIEVAIVGPVRF